MATRNYSLDDVYLTIAGQLITEFTEGDSIDVEYDEDDTVETQGTHGSVMVSERPNNIMSVTVRTMQGSPINGYLWDLRKSKRMSGSLAFDFMLRDNRGELMVTTSQAWFKKPSALGTGTEAGNREWMLKLGSPNPKDGENALG
jgi:hypothetical protein